VSELDYLNARLRAMRGFLLSRQDYEQILALPDLPALMAYLLDVSIAGSIAVMSGIIFFIVFAQTRDR